MTIPTLTTAPDAPLRSEAPATFTAKAEAFVDWQADFPTEMNAAIAAINALGFSVDSWKPAVRLKTTANHGLSGLADIDGVTPVAGDRIFVGSNTAGAENGIYVAASGAWTRATDMDASDEVMGAGIFVIAGSTYGGTLWFNTNTTAPTIGTTALTFSQFTGGGASTTQTDEGISFIVETPSNKNYKLIVKAPHGGTITETTTICTSGTCIATFKINTTALGGTANSVSSSEQSQAHSTSNAFSAGDDIVMTISSNSSCADMSVTIKYTRTLA